MRRIYPKLVRLFAAPPSWLRAAMRRGRLEDEMELELAEHLECLAADLMRAGYSAREAKRRARIALGSTVVHKDAMRASLGLRWMDELGADVRYALRMMRKSKGFTAIAVLSLGLAMGANTAIFSLARQLMYERLDVPHPEQLRMLGWDQDNKSVVHNVWGDFDPDGHGGLAGTIFSYPVYRGLLKNNSVLDGLLAFKDDGMNATVRGTAQQVQAEMVSGNYFSVLGVKPQLGRAIQPSDDAVPGQGTAAVISDGLWEREFRRSKDALGQTITLNQAAVTIVGVAPRGFTGLKNAQTSADVFVPLSLQPVVDSKGSKSLLADPDQWWLNVMGRAKPGVSDSSVQVALDVQLAAQVKGTMTVTAADTVPRLTLNDGSRGIRFPDAQFLKPIYVLLAMTALLMLLACVNVANLLLARGTQRQRELSVRLAMGAGRGRLVRQMLVESLLLSAMGGICGVAIAFLGRNAIPHLLSAPWKPLAFEVHFVWSVFAFAGGVTLLTGLLFGMAPALAAMRAEVSSTLKETSQNTTKRRKGWGGKSIVAFQMAVSTLLVICAVLFLRTLLALNSVDAGFRSDHLLLFAINPPEQRYSAGKDVQLHARLEEALRAVPGVQAVSLAAVPYIADSVSGAQLQLEGESKVGAGGQPVLHNADFNVVGNDFFHTMEIPLLEGRGFGQQDTATSTKVAVINTALARELFHGANPIGRRFLMDLPQGWLEIVGICGDTRYRNLREPAPPQFFVPYVQGTDVGDMTYAVRSSMSEAELVPSLRRVVQQADRDLPMVDIRTQVEQNEATMSQERMVASLMSGFGLVALALACVGIYGVMAYSVANRTNEIGIRLALGALPRQVLRMILREATWISLAGVAAGLGAALLLARLVKSMLYGLQPADPVSLIGGAGLLIAVGLAASWLPARRASAVEPMEALRHE